MAKRLIAYKQKNSEQWLEKKNSKDESDNESSEELITKKLTK